jgi:RNA polymerase sigma factor (sigma-70 family)
VVVVNNVEDFAKNNEEDLRRYLTSGKGKLIFDPEMVNDIIQNFYVRIIKSDALSKFDPTLASFETYIITILCNMLPHERKRNPHARYTHISVLSNPDSKSRHDEDIDVFDFVYGNSDYSGMSIDRKNMPDSVYLQEDIDSVNNMLAFIEFIKDTEPNKAKADKMVSFVEHKMQGLLATDIAVMMGVSDNMVKIMKNNIYDKFKKWENPREVNYA